MKPKWLLSFGIGLILFAILDLLLVIGHGHEIFPWSVIPGFFSLFGFLGCLLIIGLAKLLGHYWLQRKEDYYERK